MILLLISFIAGVLTVLAPCILPLLPVIIGGSLTGEGKDIQKKKVVTIVLALGVSVVAFTLLLKVSTLFIAVPEVVWKWISGGIIIGLGLITVFPTLWEGRLMAKASVQSNALLGKGSLKKSFYGDVLMGVALGPVFSSCSPTYFIILATVLPSTPLVGMVYLLTYVAGLCLSLFVIAFIGQKIMSRLNMVADPRGWVKKSLGVLFIVVGIAIISGFDKKLETSIISADIFDVTKVEQKLLESTEPKQKTPTEGGDIQNVTDQTGVTPATTTLPTGVASSTQKTAPKAMTAQASSVAEKSKKYKLAPEISTPDGFVNTGGKPLTLKGLRGKVVLLDIWTYSCINCQRTLPYLNDWYTKYKDQGLEIVGLHTPEFAFEKVQKNVEDAVKRFSINYPVVLDNDYSTWNDYGNKYWPRKYLIDMDGYIVYDHIGEGGYDETEKAVIKALAERNAQAGTAVSPSKTPSTPKDAMATEPDKVKSPEIYFGSSRNKELGNGSAGLTGEQTLTLPKDVTSNKLYLGGSWNIVSEFAENKNDARIQFKYNAKNVYFVAGSKDGVTVEIYKDGVFVKNLSIKNEQLYTLIAGDSYGEHTLEIRVKDSGLQAFTFTFG